MSTEAKYKANPIQNRNWNRTYHITFSFSLESSGNRCAKAKSAKIEKSKQQPTIMTINNNLNMYTYGQRLTYELLISGEFV